MTVRVGESRFVEAAGLRLHLLEYGHDNEPVLVVVPGITAPAALWEFVAVELARDYRVLTLDNRGRGLSDRAARYGLADYASDVLAVLDALELERPFVLGHSMGARIVTAFDALHPGRRAGLIVADPPVTGPGREPYSWALETLLGTIGLSPAELRAVFPGIDDEQLALRAEWLPTCDETAVAESYRNLHAEDFFAHWRRVAAPGLLLWGEVSDTVSPAAAAELSRENPAVEVACIAGAGHMLPWDDLAAFVASVRVFISAHPG
jgi:N-formylmaleamate deformylase